MANLHIPEYFYLSNVIQEIHVLLHSISIVIRESGSDIRFTAFGKGLSKLGHPHSASNFPFDEKRGALHLRQINVPSL